MLLIRTVLFVVCVFLPAGLRAATDSDALLARLVRQGQVSDFAGVFNEAARTNLESVLVAQRARHGVDVVTAVRSFPGVFVAGFGGFAPRTGYFKADTGADKAPTVSF